MTSSLVSDANAVSAPRPIVVDLDAMLAATRLADEQFIRALAVAPGRALVSFLRKGGGEVPASLERLAPLEADALAYNATVIDWLRARQGEGRSIHLVTAADQSLADAVAQKFALFDSAKGSSPGNRFEGPARLTWLQSHFPGGFDYLAGETNDPVASAAGRVHSRGAATAPADAALGDVFSVPKPGPRTWIEALRLHQASKNLVLFVPLILSRTFVDPAAVMKVILAFVIFSAVASSTYILNDLVDLAADRQHPKKRNRPFAAGVISARTGALAGAALLIGGLAASTLLGFAFTAVLLAYLVVTISYSFAIKRMPLGDVLAIAVLFTIRVGAGAVAIPVFVSPWLMSFSMLFFLSLALAKRHVEVIRASRLAGYTLEGRGYRPDDWPLTLAVGIASALASIVIVLLYIQDAAITIGGFKRPVFLYPIGAVILFWVLRVWLFSHRGELDDDPVAFAFKDKFSFILAGVTVLLLALAI